MSRRRGSGGLLSFFGIATIVLIVMNVIVFFGVQMTDELKIYDINWAENCTKNKYTANAVYNEEYYACPKSATRDGGYDIDYCKKISDDACIYTYTDGLSLVGKNASEKPWTFITSMFMHVDLNHLFGNMLFLFILGGIVEAAIGIRKYLLLYFLAGIFGGITMIFMTSVGLVSDNVSILGASGAIFGVLGAAAILRPMQIIYIYFLPMPLIVIGLIYIGLQAFYIFTGGEAGVANGAHMGGAIVGIIAAIYLRNKAKKQEI
ncbi:MAG: rhomboid family intramembrane serine protease [Candidatus Altiarchaeum hamiconexum]|nr:rhomboid family intramembrane serine protease [Candidatus Altarchaeum hamiconexum]